MVNLPRLAALAAFSLSPLNSKPTPDTGGLAPVVVPVTHSQNTFDTKKLNNKAKAKTGGANVNGQNCKHENYNAPDVGDQDFPPFDQQASDLYRYRQQRGVNLGSWFVHEKWMTPDQFACAAEPKEAELDIARGFNGNRDATRSFLEKHWDTFIKEGDFGYLASLGINTVRLPIGFWNLPPEYIEDTPFQDVADVYRSSWPRIKRAINHAAKNRIGVIIDLHGAPGSQNGEQHSGMSGGKKEFFTNEGYQQKTIDGLVFLAKELAQVNNVVGLQLLNEPQFTENLLSFYEKAINAIRSCSPEAQHLPLYVHDGFDLDRMSKWVAPRNDFIVQDHHSYFVFTDADKHESASSHIKDIKGAIAQAFDRVANSQHRNLIIGEWSCALDPASLENDGDADQLRKEFCTQQMEMYEKSSSGWTFWSYKRENCAEQPAGWCFTTAVGKELPKTFVQDNSPKFNQGSNRFRLVAERRAENSTTSKGYLDGYNAAQKFAHFDGSTIGFVDQYMQDRSAQGGGGGMVSPRGESEYRDEFLKGLKAFN